MAAFSRARILRAWQLLTGREEGLESSEDDDDVCVVGEGKTSSRLRITTSYGTAPAPPSSEACPDACHPDDSTSCSSVADSGSFGPPLSRSGGASGNTYPIPSLSSSSSSSGFSDVGYTGHANVSSIQTIPAQKVAVQGPWTAHPGIPSMDMSTQDVPSQPHTPVAGVYGSPLHAAPGAGAHSYTHSLLCSDSQLNQGGDSESGTSDSDSEAAGVSTPTYAPGPHLLSEDHHQQQGQLQQPHQGTQTPSANFVPFQQLLELQAALDNETCESERLRRWLAEEQADSQHAQQKCDSLSLQVESLTEQLANEQDEVKELREALSEVQQARLAAEQQLKQAQAEVAALAAQLAPQQPIKDAKDLCSSLPTPLIDCTSPTAASHANSSSHSSQASSDELAALRQALQASEAERQQLALRVQELQGTVGQHSMDLEMLTSKADFLELGKGALHEQLRSLEERYQDQVESYCLELQHMEQRYSELWEEHTQLQTTCDQLKAQLLQAQLALKGAQAAAAQPTPAPIASSAAHSSADNKPAALPSLSPVSASHIAALPPDPPTKPHASVIAGGGGTQTSAPPPPRPPPQQQDTSASSSASAWGRLNALATGPAVGGQAPASGQQVASGDLTGPAPPLPAKSSDSLEALLLQVAAKVLPKSSDEGFKSVLAAAANSAAVTLASSGHLGRSLHDSAELGALARSGNLFSTAGLQAPLLAQSQHASSSAQAGVAGDTAAGKAIPSFPAPGATAASALPSNKGMLQPPASPPTVPTCSSSDGPKHQVQMPAQAAPPAATTDSHHPGSLLISDGYEDLHLPTIAAAMQGSARQQQPDSSSVQAGSRLYGSGLGTDGQEDEDAEEVLEEEGVLSNESLCGASLESPLFCADILKRPPAPWEKAPPGDEDMPGRAEANAAAVAAVGISAGWAGLEPAIQMEGQQADASIQAALPEVQGDTKQMQAVFGGVHAVDKQHEVSVSLDISWDEDAASSSPPGTNDSSDGSRTTSTSSHGMSSAGSCGGNLGVHQSISNSCDDEPGRPGEVPVPTAPQPLDLGTPPAARTIAHGRRQTMPPA